MSLSPKKRFMVVPLLVVVALSLYCSNNSGESINEPSPDPTEKPAINKALIVGSWRLGSLKTLLEDGGEILETLTFVQTLVFNEDQTFDIENQAGFETELKNGQWSSTSVGLQLIFIENGTIILVDDYEYTVTDSNLILFLINQDFPELGTLKFTYSKV